MRGMERKKKDMDLLFFLTLFFLISNSRFSKPKVPKLTD
jgi:hypothetical protein